MNSNRITRPRSTGINICSLFVAALIMGLYIIISTGVVSAIPLNPPPPAGSMPSRIISYLEDSDSPLRLHSPSMISWISRGSSSGQESVTVMYGDSSVGLRFNSAGTVGFSPSSTTYTRTTITGTSSAGAASAVGQSTTIQYAPNQNSPGHTDANYFSFVYAPPGGFTTPGVQTITLQGRVVNQFSGGYYRCVANGAVTSNLAGTNCPTTSFPLTFQVIMPPVTCSISNIRRVSDNSTVINPGDRIQFNVSVTNAQGWRLGVNGPNYGNEYGSTNIGNYLATSSNYMRGPTINSNNYSSTVSRIVRNSDSNAPLVNFNAPNSTGNFQFNWGLVKAGFGWVPVTCNGQVTVATADLCANIPGNQASGDSIFDDYVRIGNNCYRPATCENNTVNAWVGHSRAFAITVTSNDEYSTVTVEVEYRLGSSGSWNDASPAEDTIPAEDDEVFTISTTDTDQNINWRVTTRDGSGGNQIGSRDTCRTTVNRRNIPTCNVTGTTFRVGVPSRISVEITADSDWGRNRISNRNVLINQNGSWYDYRSNAVGENYGSNLDTPGNLVGNGGSYPETSNGGVYMAGYRDDDSDGVIIVRQQTAREDTGAENRTSIMVPDLYRFGANDGVNWSLDWRDDGVWDPPANITCESPLSVTIQPLTCTSGSNSFTVGESARSTVSVVNPNAIDINVNIAGASPSTYSAASATPPVNGNLAIPTGGTNVVPANNGSQGFETDQEITYNSTGLYPVDWSIRTPYEANTNAIGDPVPYSANPTAASCPPTVNEVSRVPYLRTYGNDVVAGAVLLANNEECTDTSLVSDVSIIANGSNGAGFYQGATGELAAIATGTISGFLPGTGSYSESAGVFYPNTDLNSNDSFNSGYDFLSVAGGGSDYGGDYDGGGLCNEAFPDTSDWNDGGGIVSNGSRTYSLSRDIPGRSLGTTSGEGDRVSLYIEGDATITDNITYSSTTWSSPREIPLFRLYATGDIYINGNVTQLDGLYVAGGEIHTCTQYQATSDVALLNTVLSSCGNTLTLNGAFVSDEIVLGRTSGDVSQSNTSNNETFFGGGVKAENLNFTPELYIALWDHARERDEDNPPGTGEGTYKYISSPPPVF